VAAIAQFEAMLRAIAQNKAETKPSNETRFGFDELPAAFAHMRGGGGTSENRDRDLRRIPPESGIKIG